MGYRADLVVNSSHEDDAGWDFVVERAAHSARPQIASAPIHTETFSFRGRIQVKATDLSEGGIDVKLSNWLRMVEDPQPTFFVVLEFEGLDAPQRAFVVHVGEDLIRRALQRWHENAIGDQKPLNQIRIRLSYNPDHQLEALNGEALLEKLLDGMKEGGTSWAAYATWKAKLVHSAGFEGGNVQVRLQIPRQPDLPDDPEVILADLETGIVKSLPVEKAEIFRRRFGIADPTPFLTQEKGVLQIVENRPDPEVNVEVQAVGTSKRTQFHARLRSPSRIVNAIRKNGDLSRYKVRIIAPHVEIVADFGNRNGTFHPVTPEPTERVEAHTVKLHADLASVIATARVRNTAVEIKVTNGVDVIVQFMIEPEQLEAFGDTEIASYVLGQYVKLCRDFDVLDEATVAFGEIVDFQEALSKMSAYADPSISLNNLTFTVEEESNRFLELEDRRIAALSPWSLTLGSHTFVVVLASWGILERVREQDGVIEYRIDGDQFIRVARGASKGTADEFPFWNLINDAVYDVKKYDDPGRYIILGIEPTIKNPPELPMPQ